MTAPVFTAGLSARVSVTGTTLTCIGATNSSGANLAVQVALDEKFSIGARTSSTVALTAGNHYQASPIITGLVPGQRYWYRLVADDGVGGSTNGAFPIHAGSVETIHDKIPAGGLRFGFNTCWNHTVAQSAEQAKTSRNLFYQKLHGYFVYGDLYYAETGDTSGVADNGEYATTSWYQDGSDVASDSVVTLGRYRTNAQNVHMGEYISGQLAGLNWRGRLFANTPIFTMHDDHDGPWDNCSALPQSSGDARWARRVLAMSVWDEFYGSLTQQPITDDGRTWANWASVTPLQERYYYVDWGGRHGARIIMLDIRAFRDDNATVESSSKTFLGTVQKAWLKNLIATNTCKWLLIISPQMLDGNHGWNRSAVETWKGNSYEREEILDYIRTYGNAARTIFFSGDTHTNVVCSHGEGGRKIWEFTPGQAGLGSHGWINGLGRDANPSSDTIASTAAQNAAGGGGKLEFCSTEPRGTCLVHLTTKRLRIGMYRTQPQLEAMYVRDFV